MIPTQALAALTPARVRAAHAYVGCAFAEGVVPSAWGKSATSPGSPG